MIDNIKQKAKMIGKNGDGFWDWNEIFGNQIISNIKEAKKYYKKTQDESILQYIESTKEAGKKIYKHLKSLISFIKAKDIKNAYLTILEISEIEIDFNDDPLAGELLDLLADYFDLYTSCEFSTAGEVVIGSYDKFIKEVRPIVKDWWKQEDFDIRGNFDEYFNSIIKEKLHPLKKIIRKKNILFI